MWALSRPAESGLCPNAIRLSGRGSLRGADMTFTLAWICPVGMPDRLDSTGGLAILSTPGDGTTIMGRVPAAEEVVR